MRLYKNQWAKAPIKQYFDELYLKRDLFNEEMKAKFEDLKAQLSNNKAMDTSKKRVVIFVFGVMIILEDN